MVVENRFWRSPDLVAELIPFLDVSSILALATVQPLVLSLLQRSFIWKSLIRRSTIGENELEKYREKIRQLVEIQKLVEDPEPHLLELLHTICKRCPEEISGVKEDSVQVSCSVHPAGHKVNTTGFELLE